MCELDNEIHMKTFDDLVLSICGEYEVSWKIHNVYRNRQGLPSLPTNYQPYGPKGKEARDLLKKAFGNLEEDEPLCLKDQLEIFIEAQRS